MLDLVSFFFSFATTETNTMYKDFVHKLKEELKERFYFI